MKKSVILSIVIILVLFLAGLFILIQKQNIDIPDDKEEVKPEPIVEEIPEGWEEYVDEKYGFRIWYPKEFALEYPEIDAIGIKDQTKIQKFKDEKENVDVIDFHVNVLSDAPLRLSYIYIYNSELDIKDYVVNDTINIVKSFLWLMMQDNKEPEQYITEIKINGLNFYKLEILEENIIKYYIKKDNNIFTLSPESGDLTLYPGTKQTFEQMVKSFKFDRTDNSNTNIEDVEKRKPEPIAEKPPEGWKEYVDEEHRFRVWYPEKFNYRDMIDQTKIDEFECENEEGMVFYINFLDDNQLKLLYLCTYNSDVDIENYIINDSIKIIKNFLPWIMMQDTKKTERYTTKMEDSELNLYKLEIPNENIIKYYAKKDKNIFIFKNGNTIELTDELKATFDQMVQSFRFIE